MRSPSINTTVLLLKDPLGMFRNRFVDMSIELKKIDYCVLIFVSITINFRKTTPNFDQNFRKNYHLSLFFSNFKPAVCLTRKYSLIYFAIKHDHIQYIICIFSIKMILSYWVWHRTHIPANACSSRTCSKWSHWTFLCGCKSWGWCSVKEIWFWKEFVISSVTRP